MHDLKNSSYATLGVESNVRPAAIIPSRIISLREIAAQINVVNEMLAGHADRLLGCWEQSANCAPGQPIQASNGVVGELDDVLDELRRAVERLVINAGRNCDLA